MCTVQVCTPGVQYRCVHQVYLEVLLQLRLVLPGQDLMLLLEVGEQPLFLQLLALLQRLQLLLQPLLPLARVQTEQEAPETPRGQGPRRQGPRREGPRPGLHTQVHRGWGTQALSVTHTPPL